MDYVVAFVAHTTQLKPNLLVTNDKPYFGFCRRERSSSSPQHMSADTDGFFSPQAHVPHSTGSTRNFTRRSVLCFAVGAAVSSQVRDSRAATTDQIEVPLYDANKSRRYLSLGRPSPDRSPPKFENGKKCFPLAEGLEAQDVKPGNGETTVKRGTLVVARWSMVLDDGTSLDTTNERQAAMFRPGAHQVPPGVEDSVIGMLAGGVRRVKGSSERVLTNVVNGYDIGERSLVPNGSTIFIDIMVDGIDPFGSR